MFHKVLDNPYVGLDQYIDTIKFDSIIDDLIIGIAKSRSYTGASQPGPGYVDKSKKNVLEIYQLIKDDPTHIYHKLITGLSIQEALIFIQFKWPSHVMGRCITLRQYKEYSLKQFANGCIDTPAIENFTSFMNWLKEENIFEEIGRTIIFLNDSYSFSIEHNDYNKEIVDISRKDQLLWINPLGNKKFYIRQDNKKIYFDSRFCYFDNANFHGADPVDYSTISIKIDGIFSRYFLDKTGLVSYFK
jgi:hypothetical protein